ncbi:MAG: hypothetical protein CMO44_13170 [Verrucomicrobiales bacterium]|nr:hypothetical protein [Verrucomicrobiales bacterium]|tara:strand:- start:18980 stop:19549 length:570 start_codon:yes stop_codon:yes gene_type:complete
MEKVVKDLIVARRYTILPDPENIEPTCGRNKDKEKFRLVARGKKKNYQLQVYFSDSKEKIGVREIRTVIENAKQQNLKVLLLITIEKMTFFAQRECKSKNNSSEYPFIELWTKNELNCNIINHFTQPKFTVLSSKDKQQLLLNTDIRKFPKLLQTDPVARFLGLQKGVVVMIDRVLPGGQTTKIYRHVC